MKISKLLFCRVAVLIPLTILQAWQNMHQVVDNSKITTLLTALRIALILEVLLSLVREAVYLNYDDTLNYSAGMYHFLTAAIKSPCYFSLTVGTRMTIMGLLLLLAARLNIFILLLLAGLIPLEILNCKLLHKELRRRSRSVLEQCSGWQELAANPTACQIAEQPAQYRSTNQTQARWRILQLLDLLVRIMVVALAVYDIAINNYDLLLLSYGVIVPLFFFCLREVVYGNLSKQDVINSIYYVDEIEDKLKGHTSNSDD